MNHYNRGTVALPRIPFLTAEWRNLVMLNYAVDPALLQPYVPAGTALDSFDGKTYASLVGFEFNRTRLRGRAVPFHGAFEEVNLRFYVKRGDRRGVVFIKELVPKLAVAAIARLVFKENYQCVPMSHRFVTGPDGEPSEAEYSWGRGSGRCAMRIETGGEAFLPPDGSLGQFITEHYWGYARSASGSLEYQVEHPRWLIKNARRAAFSGDASYLYGPELAKILRREPDSAFLAQGSGVTVFQAGRIAAE